MTKVTSAVLGGTGSGGGVLGNLVGHEAYGVYHKARVGSRLGFAFSPAVISGKLLTL